MPIRKYGWKKQPPDARDLKYVPNLGLRLPDSIDMRTSCPPVYDQGALGSCTANAIGGLVEFTALKLNHNDFMPSRLFIYYNERVLEGTVNEDAGAFLRTGMRVVHNQGVAREGIWPYDISQFTVRPSNMAYANGLEHLVTAYHAVTQDALHIQACLAAGNPIVFGFTVFSSFESQSVANTGIVPMPQPHEQILGGHATLIVGYDITAQHYIVRNSWGINWGLSGYYYMPFAYVHNHNLCSDFWTATFVTNHHA